MNSIRIIPLVPDARRGVTSLMSMVYMVVFAALALGFYSQTTLNSTINHNDRRMHEARTAAESGLDFMRYQLSQVQLPPLMTEEQAFQEVRSDLAALLDGSGNLGGDTVGTIIQPAPVPPSTTLPAPYFEIPSNPNNYIATAATGPFFRVRLTRSGRDVVVTTIGRSGQTVASTVATRAATQLTFKTEEWPTDFFKYGIASKGRVGYNVTGQIIGGTPASHASILSTFAGANPVQIGSLTSTALNPTGITGNITVLNGYNPSFVGTPGAVSVGGQTSPAGLASQVVHKPAADMPEFPVADTSMYKQFATTTYTTGKALYENIIIPPNTNPTFSAGTVINGLVYVQQPNVVTFNGNVSITGIIVTEDVGVGNITTPTNHLRFEGNGGSKLPLDALTDPKFDALKQLGGAFIIAPGFDVRLSGNFGSISGHIAADQLTITGSSTSTITGSVMTLKGNPLTITGATRLSLASPGNNKWKGLRFKERFVPDNRSYQEVRVPD